MTASNPFAGSFDRLTILAALGGVAGIAWLYLWMMADGMAGMAAMATMAWPMPWSAAHFAMMLAMWWVMMAAMMLPGAAPMVLTFATINRRKRERGQPFVPTALFAAGYLVAWGGYSLAATLGQWGLEQAALMSPMMTTTSPWLGAGLFAAAGLYQWSPLKHVCLRHCRSPFDFIFNRWRDGHAGALRMGLEHGLYCLGCCWVAMALLFVGGVMNLLWVAAITLLVVAEKLFPHGQRIARLGGAAMLGFAAVLLASA